MFSKKFTTVSILGFTLLTMTGCAFNPTRAVVYSNTTSPYMATSATASDKIGRSDICTNVLGIIATGNCSIALAKKNGGISTVTSVDSIETNILFIFSSKQTVVTGK